jgi:hypothetical protein
MVVRRKVSIERGRVYLDAHPKGSFAYRAFTAFALPLSSEQTPNKRATEPLPCHYDCTKPSRWSSPQTSLEMVGQNGAMCDTFSKNSWKCFIFHCCWSSFV